MKLLPIFAMAAAVAITLSPATFAKDCGARPAKPAIPDGKTASEDAMKAANAKVVDYVKAANVYLTCMSGEMTTASGEAKDVSAEWKAQSEIFKNTPAPAK